jgi:hypothetical protein
MVYNEARCVEPQLDREKKQATGRHQRRKEELNINQKGKKRLKAFCPSTSIKQKTMVTKEVKQVIHVDKKSVKPGEVQRLYRVSTSLI